MSRHPQLLNQDNSVLVVVDVQERINAVMCSQAHIERIRALAQACRLLEVPVVATEQYPQKLGASVTSVAKHFDAAPVVKETFSCALDPDFATRVAALGRRQIIIVGIEAHVCVLQTALDLVNQGFCVHVPYDAVSSRRQADHEHALQRMAAAGIVITNTESALFELLLRAGTDEFRAVSKLIKEIPV